MRVRPVGRGASFQHSRLRTPFHATSASGFSLPSGLFHLGRDFSSRAGSRLRKGAHRKESPRDERASVCEWLPIVLLPPLHATSRLLTLACVRSPPTAPSHPSFSSDTSRASCTGHHLPVSHGWQRLYGHRVFFFFLPPHQKEDPPYVRVSFRL